MSSPINPLDSRPVEHFIEQMDVKVINPCESDRRSLEVHLNSGRIIVNAQRPLPGDFQWENTMLPGMFWSAHTPSLEVVKQWYRLGAWLVKLTSNEEIIQAAKLRYEELCIISPFPRRTWEDRVAKSGLQNTIRLSAPYLPLLQGYSE